MDDLHHQMAIFQGGSNSNNGMPGMNGNPSQVQSFSLGGNPANSGHNGGAPLPPMGGMGPGLPPFPGSRRVSVGGMVGMADRRRASVGLGPGFPLDASMSDFFGGRRLSIGLDAMDTLLGRRDSLESSSAAIDAHILDFTRKRFSMTMGAPQPPGGASGNSPGNDSKASQSSSVSGGTNASNSVPGNLPGNLPGNFPNNLPGNLPGGLPGGFPGNLANFPNPMMMQGQNPFSSAPPRNHQQEQLLQLEKAQKELELQKQQLLAGMQDNPTQSANNPVQQATSQPITGGFPSMGNLGNMNMGNLGNMNNGGSTRMPQSLSQGMGKQDGDESQQQARRQQPPPRQQHHQPPPRQQHQPQASQQQQQQPQWHICRICKSKAFASREEGMQHEAICAERNKNCGQQVEHIKQQQQQPPSQMPPPSDALRTMASMANMNQRESHQGEMLPGDAGGGDGAPFKPLPEPRPLAMKSDRDWLTPLHCFVRENCVEVFSATEQDVITPSKGKRKPIQVGQVGIRCPHCHTCEASSGQRERGSVYYPTTISSIYNATMNLLQRHLHSCKSVPTNIMEQYQTLKADDARSGTSKKYWIQSALSLGLVDTPQGIRFSAGTPPPLPRANRQLHQSMSKRVPSDILKSHQGNERSLPGSGTGSLSLLPAATALGESGDEIVDQGADAKPLVSPEDKAYATEFSYHLLSQMQRCSFTEADRLGKRKGLPIGFAGLACRHCFGGYGSGRFFPSSIKTLSDTSKTLNVLHNHMTRCRMCPTEVRETLEKLRAHHDDERSKMKFGSQKAFFAKIWLRLHDGNKPSATPLPGMKRKAPPTFPDPAPDLGPGGNSLMGHPKHPMMVPLPTNPGQMMGGLDVLSRQAENMNDNKRQRMEFGS